MSAQEEKHWPLSPDQLAERLQTAADVFCNDRAASVAQLRWLLGLQLTALEAKLDAAAGYDWTCPTHGPFKGHNGRCPGQKCYEAECKTERLESLAAWIRGVQAEVTALRTVLTEIATTTQKWVSGETNAGFACRLQNFAREALKPKEAV